MLVDNTQLKVCSELRSLLLFQKEFKSDNYV